MKKIGFSAAFAALSLAATCVFAQHGASYEDILAHYYRGTTLGPAPISKVRVYLADGAIAGVTLLVEEVG